VTGYQLVWDDTRTGRLRPNHDHSPTLAWLRLTWPMGVGFGQDLERVDIYTHHPEVTGRAWVAAAVSIAAAVPDALGASPWEHHRIVTPTTAAPVERREKD
jgi:hypothetical protein